MGHGDGPGPGGDPDSLKKRVDRSPRAMRGGSALIDRGEFGR